MITRRRFIAISASMVAAAKVPAYAAVTNWKGRAFGAEVHISLNGESRKTQAALDAAKDTMVRLERLFSLYDPASSLSVLNRTGKLTMPPEFAQLMTLCEQVNRWTGGLFDPTVQPLFEANARTDQPLTTGKRDDVLRRVGWRFVTTSADNLAFEKTGMAITLNGIAQGFASDRVTEVLLAHGFKDAVVNIGEYRAGNVQAEIDFENFHGRRIGNVTLKNAAVATTSSQGYTFSNGEGHILSPQKESSNNHWNTMSVVAKTATIADGLSTALALTDDLALARRLIDDGIILTVIAEDRSGKISRLG